MKITTAQYAKALEASVENKSNEEISGVIANFLKVLKKNNQMKLANKIVEKFSEIYDKKNGVVEAFVTSAIKLDNKNLKEIEEFIVKKYNAKKVVLTQIVKKEIKGGIVLKVGDEMLDASVSRRLEEMGRGLMR